MYCSYAHRHCAGYPCLFFAANLDASKTGKLKHDKMSTSRVTQSDCKMEHENDGWLVDYLRP